MVNGSSGGRMNTKIDMNKVKYNKRFNYTKHVFFDENALDCEGTKFQIIKFKDGVQENQHYHTKTTEIFLTLYGLGIININGTMNECDAGSIVLCEVGDIHSFKALGDWTIAVFKTNETKDDIVWMRK